MAQPEARLPVSRRRGTKQYLVLACSVVVFLAAAGAVSFYSDEIHLYFALGGWNAGVARRTTEQFIQRVQAGRLPAALALVDPESYKPYTAGGKMVGLEHEDVSGRGRYYILFTEMIPPGKAETRPVQLTTADQGGFVVPVRFADGSEGWFVVGRVRDGYRIVSLPMIPGRFHY